MNKIIICADDFAQNDAISHGIIKLIENNRLSATSCMTNLESWPEHSLLLKKITTIDMGVHLNFTHGKPLSKALQKQFKSWPNSILSIIKLIISKQLTLTKLENEIELQLNNFEKYINKIPDFIDGHQHLHHFPVIRQQLDLGILEQWPSVKIGDDFINGLVESLPGLQEHGCSHRSD